MTRPSIPTVLPFNEALQLGASTPADTAQETDELGRLDLEVKARIIATLLPQVLQSDVATQGIIRRLMLSWLSDLPLPVREVYVTDGRQMEFVVAERRQRSLRMFTIIGMFVGLVAAALLLWNGFDAGTINVDSAVTSTQYAVSSLVDTTWFAELLLIVFTIVGGLGGALVGVLARDPMTRLEGHMAVRDINGVYYPVHVRYETTN